LQGQLVACDHGDVWVNDGSLTQIERQLAPLWAQRSLTMTVPQGWVVTPSKAARLLTEREKLVLSSQDQSRWCRSMAVSWCSPPTARAEFSELAATPWCSTHQIHGE